MTDPDLERLFWEAFDESPSTARLERIEQLSQARPEMRREIEKLRALAEELDAVADVAPPPELGIEVRRRVRERPAYDGAAAAGFVDWMRQALATGWKPRLAYATLGALIGVFCASLYINGLSPISEADRSRLSGALNVSTADTRPLEIQLADSAGTLRLARQGTHLVSTLLPGPNTTLELSVSRAAGGLEPLRVESIQAMRHELTTRPGAVRIVADGPISLVLDAGSEGSPSVTARVMTSAGETLLDRQLDLAQLPGGD